MQAGQGAMARNPTLQGPPSSARLHGCLWRLGTRQLSTEAALGFPASGSPSMSPLCPSLGRGFLGSL